MCEECFDKEHKRFPSQSDFEKFEEELDLKCKSKKIEILESKNEVESGLMDFRIYYKCNTCNEKYIMSIPDNAWRGYFLTEKNAIEYHNILKVSDRKKRNGCLIVIILIILMAIYTMIR